ncbi:MAG: sulfurtransferase [Candidatus Tectimicrobiota bacterium]
MTDPVKGYRNDSLIITPEALLERLDDPDLVLIDTRPLDEYHAGHLPGACHVDLFRLRLKDSSDAALAAFHQTMEHILADSGVTPASTLVFYDEVSGMRAARGVYLIEYFGSHQAAMLDGGLTAWQAAGGALTVEVPQPTPGSFTVRPVEEYVATCHYILESLERDEVVVVDARRPTEYAGDEVRASRGGHIPHAVNIEWTENLDPSGAFKSADALQALYTAHGVTPDKEIITYCHGGYRSSNTWLALKLIGYPRVRNYLASWAEWADRDDLPVAHPGSP